MRTEFVYSLMALGAIPVVANASNADVQAISGDVLASTDGSKVTYPVGKLVPGKYYFTANVLSKVYGVTIEIAGKQQVLADGNSSDAQSVNIEFTLESETDVTLTFVSSDPGEPGAGFTVAGALVSLDYDFATIKSTLAANANALATTIGGYNYEAKDEDVNAAKALKKKAEDIEGKYDEYKSFKLYADKSTIQEEIDALAKKAADAEAAYQNSEAYNRVNTAVAAIKAKYNAAVAELEQTLVGVAAYLLDGAKAELNEKINLKITDATQASYASYQAGTAVADEAANTAMVPTEAALNTIVNDYKAQATSNTNAYNALHKIVTDLQASLDAINPRATIVSQFSKEKSDAQAAINAVNTKVEAAKNSADQLTLSVATEKKAAEDLITPLAAKVDKANAEYDANDLTVKAIATVQKAKDDAKKVVDAKVSKDGKYKAQDYYADYLKTQQDAINKLTADAAAAYKADGTGTAQAYNSGLAAKAAPITAAIDDYKKNAVDAVDKYDALQTALTGYTTDITAARAKIEDLEVYTAEGYDYQTKLDLIQKRINDIKKAITAAQEKKGSDHWTAMLAIDDDAAITADIAGLVGSYQADQNKYDADQLETGMQTLSGKITAFQAKNASELGADIEVLKGVEKDIKDAYDVVKAEKDAIDPNTDFVDRTSLVKTGEADWAVGTIGHSGSTPRTPAVGLINGVQMIDQWNSSSNNTTGTALVQKLSGLPNGTYTVEIYASAVDQATGNPNKDKTDIAAVFANGVETPVKVTTGVELNAYTIENVVVSDGTLEMGLKKKKAGSNWHLIQIKSLQIATASLIQDWGAKIDELNTQQTALETLGADITAKIAANTKAKTDLATNIGGLQTKINTFKTTYNIGDNANTTLGNRGKADGSVTKEVKDIEDALNTLKSANNDFDPTAVTTIDNTSKVGTGKNSWLRGVTQASGNYGVKTKDANHPVDMIEVWSSKASDIGNGKVLYQKLTNLNNGIYTVELYAKANGGTQGATDVISVYANDKSQYITLKNDEVYTVKLDNVMVQDGVLEMGMLKHKENSTNWHLIQIKSLTIHDNDLLSTYTTKDTGYNAQYTALANQEKALEDAAPGIKTAVANNATAKGAADQAVAALGTYEVTTLKNLKDVSDASGNFSTSNAKKADPKNWAVFRSGLASDKNYAAKKKSIDDFITALTNAINAANATETLPYPWADEITVVTEDDPATKDVNEASTTTYKISEIKTLIDNLKTEAAAESENYWAYRNTSKAYFNVNIDETNIAGSGLGDGTLDKEIPQAKNDLKEIEKVVGEGAEPYYSGLIASYESERSTIIGKMLASLNGRTAKADNSGYVNELKALINKLKAVKTNADANLKKYNEQKKAAEETQKLWNDTYTEIAATNHSSKVQDFLDQLDAIQVMLTAAAEAVETNYTKGESVAKAKDFAAIKTSINNVKAQEQSTYNGSIADDNKAAHESFMGNAETKGSIQLATEAYQTAVQERAQYSSTNADIKAAVDGAAKTLDEYLYGCPDDIAKLTKDENDAYVANSEANAALKEGERATAFDVDPFNTAATTIEQDVTAKLDAFKDDVKTAIQGFWNPKKSTYNSTVTSYESQIADYSDKAKKDAFKDVKDLIAKGDAGVNEWTLSKVEEAVAALENIEDLLKADRDKAAEKDITPRIAEADKKYSDVKKYIEGVSNDIQAKADNLSLLENAYADIADEKALDKTFDNRNTIKSAMEQFVSLADGYKSNVETAVTNDNKNTAAYNEMIDAITPVAEKLKEAETKAAYKYATSFNSVKSDLENVQTEAESYKKNGSAFSEKDNVLSDVATISSSIEATLTTAFGTEKTGLATDVAELKNQYNNYVAANGLDAKATAFKADIDALEKQRTDIAITDADKPADGIQYDEILAATEALIKLEGDIADKQTELLAANASQANANTLADFNSQIAALEATASLEGYDEWVGQQKINNKTLQERITDLKAQIDDLKAAIEAEPNISFYKDQYQEQIDKVKENLDPVAAAISAKDAQFKTNAAAYARLTAEINDLQAKIDAAKAKVGAYEYNYIYSYFYYIEDYDYNSASELVLSGGAQYYLNLAKSAIEYRNNIKSLDGNSTVSYKNSIENSVQNYLDESASAELRCQRDNLKTLLSYAIDVKKKSETYSAVLWARLEAEKSGISDEIVDLYKSIYYSSELNEGSFDTFTYNWTNVNIDGRWYYYYYSLDENDTPISKPRTSNVDYAAQMETVAAIKEKIATLSTAVDNLDLLGDANVDGKVNVLDYQKVLNMILDPTLQPEKTTDLFVNIDINQSEVIEVGDLTAIVNYILNKNWQGYAAARGEKVSGESMAMNVSSQATGQQRIAVSLTNVSSYTAFQMDVVLPDGMKIVGTELSNRAAESHKLYGRSQMDGSYRVLASSVSGEAFSGNEGAVLYIDVETTKEYMGGSVELVNILFSDVNAETRSFTIGGEATGIDTVSTFESLKQKVYDLSGRVKDGLKKGINIIRRADGSTGKVVK